MVGTSDSRFECSVLFLSSRRFDEFGPSMTTDVIESAQHAGLVANQQDALPENVDQAVIAFAFQAFESTCAEPFAVKNQFALA